MTADLLIGPLLRRVAGTRATIWVETSATATVRVEADGGATGSAPTFAAYGHHYALVVVEGLAPDSAAAYRVLIDDEPAWPLPDSPYPASVIRTRPAADETTPVRLIFGSCREATPEATSRHLPPDALDAYARRLMTDESTRPDLMVLLGDQVYADNTSDKVKDFLRHRRVHGSDEPADQVVSYEEYTRLYLESWRDPEIRWLLATVPSVMIFDDHEIIDDWNTSATWRHDIARQPWWAERITSGLASYWVYQHLGNLSPDELAADPLFAKVAGSGDATDLLAEFGRSVDDGTRPYRWSYALDLGRTRLVMLDNRCGRVLTPGDRSMLSADEWAWFTEQAAGSYDHLVVGASLPWLMPPAIHHLEAWNESAADSSNARVAHRAERIRRIFDLEHWASFGRSFEALGELFRRIGSGPDAPASISVLGGDVHHSYVARANLGTATPVMQLTSSPVFNQVQAFMRPFMRFSWSRVAARAVRLFAKSAGVPKPAWNWTRLAGPYFGNAISTLRLSGRDATVRVEGTVKSGALVTVAEVDYPAAGSSSTLRR